MSIPSESAGTALVCDTRGNILRVTRDQLGLAELCGSCTPFVEIVDHASKQKAVEFLDAINEDGAVFDWELCVPIRGRLTLLHCLGVSNDSQMCVILSATDVAAVKVLEEMSLIQNEQANMLRDALKRISAPPKPSISDESQFEELTRLYNDVGRVQRELAHRNAELEALRTRLETKQAELIAANAKLDELATLDGLTGIANRRAFQARLESECLRASRYPVPLSLIILDLDHFKSLNDTYGHQAGDDTLRTIGRLLISAARNTDLAARYGGEEFGVILVNTDNFAATEAAERLRQLIEAEAWLHRAITASIGIASTTTGATSAVELISQADQALYFSKRNGRNRATHYLNLNPTDRQPKTD